MPARIVIARKYWISLRFADWFSWSALTIVQPQHKITIQVWLSSRIQVRCKNLRQCCCETLLSVFVRMHVMFCISTDKKQCWSVLRTVTSTDLRVLLSAGKDGSCSSPTLPFASTPNVTTIVPTLGVRCSLLKNVPDHFFVSSTRFRTLFAIVRHWSTSRWPLLRYIHTVPDTLSLFAIRFRHRKTSYRPVLRDACTFPNTLLLSAFPSCSAGKYLLRLLLGYDPTSPNIARDSVVVSWKRQSSRLRYLYTSTCSHLQPSSW